VGSVNQTAIIAETLTQHHDWQWSIRKKQMSCAGCDWSRPMNYAEPCDPAFRQHQAEQVAAALAQQPVKHDPREDLTMFAALLARLGGDVRVTWAEARRLRGVTVTRWDEPEYMRHRFTLGAAEFNTPADLGVGPGKVALRMPDGSYKSVDEIRNEVAAPAHQCESWQIRRNDLGDRYCAACGAKQ
jgi:hypothetical protein